MKITNLILATANLNNIIPFYQTTLGLPLIEQTQNEVHFQAGETRLIFRETTKNTAPYHFAFNIATNHLEQAITWANTNQIPLLPSPKNEIITHFDTWKAESIYFWDTDGNLLEFIAREDTQTRKTEAFSPREMLNISEIGIITKNPIATAEAIKKQTDLDFFAKSTPLPEFCALGDDEGLLILVSPTRNWYPTDHLAQKSPATIQIESAGKTHTIQSFDWE